MTGSSPAGSRPEPGGPRDPSKWLVRVGGDQGGRGEQWASVLLRLAGL